VVAINDPKTPTGRTGRARRINLGIFGNPTVAGLIGFIGLLVAMASALIAYLDWQGNVAERAAITATEPAQSKAAQSTAPITPSSPPAASDTSRPPTAANPKAIAQTTAAPAADLSYRLNASPVDSHTVKVTAKASGQPRRGLTYWFVLEVNWGGGNIDYYPRRTLTGSSSTFEVSIPANADPRYARQGRIYGLNNTQNTQAEVKLEAQSTTEEDDYFDNATGQAVSNATTLPY
jgi:hypothetical protein